MDKETINPANLKPLPGQAQFYYEMDEKAVIRVFYKTQNNEYRKLARMAKADGLWIYGEAAPMLTFYAGAIQDLYNIFFTEKVF